MTADKSAEGAQPIFENETLQALQNRALTYLRAGIPVHFRGPAGTGKTTLAFQVASALDRPTVLVTGDAMMESASLVGAETGTRTKQVVDQYVHSIKKVETETETIWADNVLTRAIVEGYTLIYDEFTRSPAAANNALLSALEERMLVIESASREDRYVQAHPEFRAIFTSNPLDYAGVNAPQDALMDRLLTLDFDDLGLETEVGIVATRAGCDPIVAERSVKLVRMLRKSPNTAQAISLRSAIMIAKIAHSEAFAPSIQDPDFVQLVFDALTSKAASTAAGSDVRQHFKGEIQAAIRAVCTPLQAPAIAAASDVGAAMDPTPASLPDSSTQVQQLRAV